MAKGRSDLKLQLIEARRIILKVVDNVVYGNDGFQFGRREFAKTTHDTSHDVGGRGVDTQRNAAVEDRSNESHGLDDETFHAAVTCGTRESMNIAEPNLEVKIAAGDLIQTELEETEGSARVYKDMLPERRVIDDETTMCSPKDIRARRVVLGERVRSIALAEHAQYSGDHFGRNITSGEGALET